MFTLFKECARSSTGDGSKGQVNHCRRTGSSPTRPSVPPCSLHNYGHLPHLCSALCFRFVPLTGLFSFSPFFFSSPVLSGPLICICFKLLLSCAQLFCDLMNWAPLIGLLCPWDSPGKNTRVDSHFLLQGIFPTQGSNPCLLHWQADS